jgi:hypothetical protein
MSRLNSLSAAAIKAMFSSETDQQLIMLLTIYDPAFVSGSTTVTVDPVRLADGYTGRLTSITTDDEVYYGVTSRSSDYVFIPMSMSLPSEQDNGVGQCSITINYVTPEAITLIRQHLTGPCKVLIELVLSGSPDTVEASFPGFYITSVSYNAESITLALNMISLNTEPFPSFNFTPSYFPGLF